MGTRHLVIAAIGFTMLAAPATAGAQSTVAISLPCLQTGLLPPIGNCPAPPPPPRSDTCESTTVVPTQASIDDARAATLCLLNKQRTSRGLRTLDTSAALETAAARFSRKMVAEGFFAHVSPHGSTLASRVRATSFLEGVRTFSLGENIAWGSRRLATPVEIVDGWMHSTAHRRNILDPDFRSIGVGIAPGAPRPGVDSAATYTTDFGVRG